MSVNVFGHSLSKNKTGSRGPPGIGYKLTSDGHFDIENKRICNIANPSEQADAVNLLTLIRTVRENKETLKKELDQEVYNFKKDVTNWLVTFKSEVKKKYREEQIQFKKEVTNLLVLFKSEVEKSLNFDPSGNLVKIEEIPNEHKLAEHLNEHREELKKDV